MEKLPSTIKNMVLSLSVISLVMSAALGFVYVATKEPIDLANNKKLVEAISTVVPAFDNNPFKEKYIVDGYEGLEFYPAKKEGKVVGTSVKTYTTKGFSGFIWLMVGLLPDGTINNISILEQKETPGLGTKMSEPKFKDQFNNKNPGSFKVIVKKDGGQVDAITASTITSRAFCDAVQRAYDAYMKGGQK
jgi:Na+-translocating ferredoxin:NAD+ oxidoreductase subunit G